MGVNMMLLKQAAAEVGLSPHALTVMIKQHKVPYLKIGEGRGKYVFDIDLLKEALREQALTNGCFQSVNVVNYGQLRQVKS